MLLVFLLVYLLLLYFLFVLFKLVELIKLSQVYDLNFLFIFENTCVYIEKKACGKHNPYPLLTITYENERKEDEN
jgi:hypothetical protein